MSCSNEGDVVERDCVAFVVVEENLFASVEEQVSTGQRVVTTVVKKREITAECGTIDQPPKSPRLLLVRGVEKRAAKKAPLERKRL